MRAQDFRYSCLACSTEAHRHLRSRFLFTWPKAEVSTELALIIGDYF